MALFLKENPLFLWRYRDDEVKQRGIKKGAKLTSEVKKR